jgi:hypothetical protein
MKEDIIQYKGTNPLIGIPASLTLVAYILSIIAKIPLIWTEEDGWKGAIGVMLVIISTPFELFLPFYFIGEFLTSKPGTIYASKRTVRATVVISSLIGMAFLLFFHALLKKPTFSTTLSSLCYALSAFGVILLLAHFMTALCGDVTAKIKPDRKSQPSCVFLSPVVGLVSCLSLALYQHNQDKIGVDAGESRFFLFTVGAIALLWFEDKASGIADREIIPLCTASILWIGSALLANYAYASLASVTVVLPYLVYFLPLILLGFYYYISAPEES